MFQNISSVPRYISQDEVDGPRPESYFEDFELASELNEEDRTRLYTEMKSGAESGWDYSTRWMVSAIEGVSGATSKLEDTKATCIIPVELNSFLHKNAVLGSVHKRDDELFALWCAFP